MNQRQLRADINAGAGGNPAQLNARRARLVHSANRFVIQAGLGLAGNGPHLTQQQTQNLAAARRTINAINRRKRILANITTTPGHSPRSLRALRERLMAAINAPLNAAEARVAVQRVNRILNAIPGTGKNWYTAMRRHHPGKRITRHGAENWARPASRQRSASRSRNRTPSARRAKSV
jgi:hypothetical protein